MNILKYILIVLLSAVILLWYAMFLGAQTTPTLTEVQRLTLQNKVLVFQLAQVQLEKARGEIEAVLKELQQPGYDFDINTLTYTPKKAEK